jgi:hypothetical protein
MRKWIAPAVLAVSLLLATLALAQGTLSTDRWVIAGGGGSATVEGTFTGGTIGQSMVGYGQAGATQLGSGFWGGGATREDRVYLPLVVRNQ